jgi:CRISPR-associated protein Cas2
MEYPICCDVRNSRRPCRVHELRKDYGHPVQQSVFECELEGGELERLLGMLQGWLEASEDSCGVYSLCRTCERRKKVLGGAGHGTGPG